MDNTSFGLNKYDCYQKITSQTLNLIFIIQIALHVASSFGGAQFYLSCAQVDVVNGGSGNPGPLVSFPGVYTGVSLLLYSAAVFD